MKNIYEVKSANRFKSVIIIILFAVFTGFAVYILTTALGIGMGYEPGGLGYFGFAMIVSGFMTFGSYFYSDKIVLAISNAHVADRDRYFDFYTVCENLAIASGLPKPKLYVIQDSAPNAFATGRNPEHSVVCATTGLLEKLTRTELEGVVAHELSHIRNYDMLLMSLVSVMVGIVALLGDWFLRISFRGRRSDEEKGQIGAIIMVIGLIFALLSPIISQLIQLAISRRREYMADAGSVELTRQPMGLISALKKISADKEPLEAANKATAHLYIANPFKNIKSGGRSWFSSLFNTHPPVEDRIKILSEMA